MSVLSLVNVTERVRAQESVEAERRRFNDVLEVLPAYLVLLTPDYQCSLLPTVFSGNASANPRAGAALSICSAAASLAQVCESFTALKTMAPHQWEWTGPDGRNYAVFDFPFTDTDGSTLILEMGIDITEAQAGRGGAEGCFSLYPQPH